MPIDENPRNTKIEYQYISLLRFFKSNHHTVSGIVLIGVLYNFQLWIMAKISWTSKLSVIYRVYESITNSDSNNSCRLLYCCWL